MKREIKFRGKTFGGKWVEGYYVVEKSTGNHKITDGLLDINVVKEETVGMNTGCLDINGNEIWEGDIVEAVCLKANNQLGQKKRAYVSYDGDMAAFVLMEVGDKHGGTLYMNNNEAALEVIGNIHDDEALLTGASDKLLDTKIANLPLSVRALCVLKSADIETVRDLVRLTRMDMLKYRNSGRKTLTELDEWLEDNGLTWGMYV